MDLFDAAGTDNQGIPKVDPGAPLAVRMRPTSLEQVVGQDHLLGEGQPLRRLLQAQTKQQAGVASVILWGPPGTGKTTLAYLVARSSNRHFVELSAVSAGVKELRSCITSARRRLAASGEETVLFVDEVHRFTKSQQDALLPGVENRWVTLMAATTENPTFSVISPLLSRSLLLTLVPLSEAAIAQLLRRALSAEDGLAGKATLANEAEETLIRLAGADARKALTILEASAGAVLDAGRQEIGTDDISAAADVALVRYGVDQHYDVASAFIKSMRGSDVDAALHYLARMLEAGEDPRFIARRVMIAAAEEVGMADPTVLGTTVAAAQAVALIGMPEARIILAEAVVAVATAPKSNASYLAIDAAIADVRAGKAGPVPIPLRDPHYPGAKEQQSQAPYKYAHDAPHAIASQEYLPAELTGRRYYQPTDRGNERQIAVRLAKVREILQMR